jgi:hypothetical protein
LRLYRCSRAVTVFLRPILLLLLMLIRGADAKPQPPAHPFIIVREAEYDSLRARASRWPWSVMKQKAMEAISTLRYHADATRYRKAMLVHDLGSACALARILDPSGAAKYAAIVAGDVRTALHDLRVWKETPGSPDEHETNVTSSHAAFMTYLVLDILYKDLDPAVRKGVEEDCDYIAGHHRASWWESKYAIEGICELYHRGVSEEFRRKKELYRMYLLNATSNDGVYTTGPGYAHSRLYMEERVQKKMFMDVCEYQGFHEFYSEPRLQKLYEWLFGYSMAPFNRTYTFGDSPPTKFFTEYSSAALRAGRFSPAAREYAFWHIGFPGEHVWKGGLLQYLSCESATFDTRRPPSRIFANGGAWLLDHEDPSESLAGVLWNINTINESHSHFDANSINIAGYGEFVLRNSGYDGWKEPDSLTWEWIHRKAESSNTLTVEDADHADFRGGGITEGILGLGVEYATGTSGPSLAGATHERSLVFVRPEKGVPGYFMVIDEVKTPAGHTTVHLLLHPNATDQPVVFAENQEYDWRIRSCITSRLLRTRIFLAQAPQKVEVKRGYLASNDSCNCFAGRYMRATYATGGNGRARIATVIYPYPSGAHVPRWERISSDASHGMSMAIAGGMRDYLLTADDERDYAFADVSANAVVVYWREGDGGVKSFLVRRGTRFLHGRRYPVGFESEKRISLVMSGEEAMVLSPGTTVTFHLPELEGVTIDGSRAVPVRSGAGFIQVFVPQGDHRIGFPGYRAGGFGDRIRSRD